MIPIKYHIRLLNTLRKSFSKIFLIEGLLEGSFISISESNYFKSFEYYDGIGGYVPFKIFSTKPFIPEENK